MVPQKPNCEQHTFKGHVLFSAAANGPHSANALQLEVQFEPQKSGPKLEHTYKMVIGRAIDIDMPAET